ncbi:DUF2796 domain-containing protein [Loktanella salsilacus]|uniref:zinc uptake protein ZrgA n=1 Tax=Loktanella salsilacus TaxID=195913 RepID=UPI0037350615
MKKLATVVLASCIAIPAHAQDTRQMDAHVHGVSALQVAVEGGTLSLDLTSPGVDVVGFEYEASTDADKDAVAAAIGQFLTPGDIVALPDAAGCRLSAASAHLDLGDDHGDDHDSHDDHDDHAEEHDEHDDHAEEHDDHDDHEGEAGTHSAFHAAYTYECDAPDALTSLSFPFFDQFANAQEIEAEYVTAAGAGQAEISRDVAQLDLN